MKKILSILCGFILLLGFVPKTYAEGQAGTTLTASVDVTPHWTETFGWEIQKSVTPDTLNMFKGDSGTSEYTVTLTKGSETEESYVDGEICVTNGGAEATENLAITAELKNGYNPPRDFLTSAPVDLSANPVLASGQTFCYPYRVNIPITGGAYPQPHAGGTYKVTADITITNHSGHLGKPFGPSPSETTTFPSSQTTVNDSINVDDTNGETWQFSNSGSQTYSETFTCNDDEGKNDNTATIRETKQDDSATVTVNCYSLEVTKDANTSFIKTYSWSIDKSADQSTLTLALGEIFEVNYTVTVDNTGLTESDWNVKGNIAIYNPAPIGATINSVTDVISPDINATVDCGEEFPYILASKGTLNCTYSKDLPNADSRTNTATAKLQNTPSGTTDFTGSSDIDFTDATITKYDTCIDVSDTYAGSLGTVCVENTLPKTFNYSRDVGPYGESGAYRFDNTASFITNDTGATGSDDWEVEINVPFMGCTLTQGYWKTHSSNGPAPYDDAWALLPGGQGANTQFYSSGKTWYQVFKTAPAGNAYYQLAHQYMAAELNILNGVYSHIILPYIHTAQILLTTYNPAQVATLKGNNLIRTQFVSLAGTLARFNEGITGPGHCSELSAY